MDDPFASGFDPLPLLPETPEPRPPDPALPPQLTDGAGGTRHPPRTAGDDLARLLRLLYSHNPFYCVSAFLVLWGLVKSFHMHGGTLQPELLMTGLGGYTLLLAAVGCLLIRTGQLWEDIRTILLLIVLIFLAISMSFDEVLSADLATGRLYFLGGLAFSVVVSELVLRGVRLHLPILFRLPYYGLLAIFFLYPLLLGPWQEQENDPHLRWLLAGFSPLAGLLTLTLLPAIRRARIMCAITVLPGDGPGIRGRCSSCWAWASACAATRCAFPSIRAEVRRRCLSLISSCPFCLPSISFSWRSALFPGGQPCFAG